MSDYGGQRRVSSSNDDIYFGFEGSLALQSLPCLSWCLWIEKGEERMREEETVFMGWRRSILNGTHIEEKSSVAHQWIYGQVWEGDIHCLFSQWQMIGWRDGDGKERNIEDNFFTITQQEEKVLINGRGMEMSCVNGKLKVPWGFRDPKIDDDMC